MAFTWRCLVPVLWQKSNVPLKKCSVKDVNSSACCLLSTPKCYFGVLTHQGQNSCAKAVLKMLQKMLFVLFQFMNGSSSQGLQAVRLASFFPVDTTITQCVGEQKDVVAAILCCRLVFFRPKWATCSPLCV